MGARSSSATTRSARSWPSCGSRAHRPGGCRRGADGAGHLPGPRPPRVPPRRPQPALDDRDHRAPHPRGQDLLLRVFLDAFSRPTVGWSIESTQTTVLVTNARGMATARRERAGGLVIHSDCGVQFTSWAFSRKVRDAGIAPSIGAVGSAYDNAMVESFWGGCRSSSSTANAGRPGSSHRDPRLHRAFTTTPAAGTRRSGCSAQADTRTYTTGPGKPPDSRTATPFIGGRSPASSPATSGYGLLAAKIPEFGGVSINEVPTFRADQQPYGGVKDSGNTREGPAFAVLELTEKRVAWLQG
jgi:transposase InsO family protein